MPPDTLSSSWGLLTVSANTEDGGIACTQRLSIMVVESWEPILYERNWNGINWSKWARIATVTKPQEFDLPLAEGIIATGWGAPLYWKNQFDEVTVLLFVASSSGTISSQQMVALLPAGFRPSNRVSAPAYCNMSSGANGFVSIEPSGEIYISNSSNDVFLNGCAMISFIAAD